MLHVTEAAITLLDEIKRPDGRVLRLQATGDEGRLGLVLGAGMHDDLVVQRPGHQALHIPADLSSRFARAVLDRADTPSGPGLSLRRPS